MELQEYVVTNTSGSPVFQLIEDYIQEYKEYFWKCNYCRSMNFEVKKSNCMNCGAPKENNDKTIS